MQDSVAQEMQKLRGEMQQERTVLREDMQQLRSVIHDQLTLLENEQSKLKAKVISIMNNTA